ncbi:YraN family protein [Nocardia ninae]|uniref:UPF0102 protein NN4_83500 n=1 Tax=Nocardia ninae NBRC 108245 TaxID=1210091 RepID=A0A511MTU0_9NOCA|nr:YraN family protein [Nocardia ninae]GEM43831.1 UPF0102 protein [Nocardia ninae NBRC 108245]
MHSDPTPQTRAEELVAQYLTSAGIKILDRNWRRSCGEISLIAQDGDTTAFVQVHAQTISPFQVPVAAVTFLKRQRLRRTALLWLAEHDGPWWKIRFDVAAVLLDPDHESEVQYFQAAF